jgi:UPF0176 protein
MKYQVLAFYHLVPIEDPSAEVLRHQEFFKTRDIRSRIYISQEGINAQMSAREDHAVEYIEWLKSDVRFKDVVFKIHFADEQVFPKATVKVRKQLVAIDYNTDLSSRGVHLNPDQWDKMLDEKDPNTILIDVRNDYEWKVGHFEGASLPPLETFREFPQYAKDLKNEKDPKKTRVMMYCTGGIRCEYYSALMKQEGFENVYQLNGGVIQYGMDQGQSHWRGKLFVFDDRLVVPIAKNADEVISSCSYCNAQVDSYYNCANMDCNKLFISCSKCIEEHKGCCCSSCQEKGALRPINPGANAKPFRKISADEKKQIREHHVL